MNLLPEHITAGLNDAARSRLGVIAQRVQQLQASGIPADQIAPAIQQELQAVPGMIPLQNAYALYNYLKTHPMQPAQPTPESAVVNMARQVVQKDAMQRQPIPAPVQTAMPAPMPAATPAVNPQQGGIADLPVNNIGRNYVGGGLVAFDDGGEVQHYDGRTGSLVNNDYSSVPYSESWIGRPLTALGGFLESAAGDIGRSELARAATLQNPSSVMFGGPLLPVDARVQPAALTTPSAPTPNFPGMAPVTDPFAMPTPSIGPAQGVSPEDIVPPARGDIGDAAMSEYMRMFGSPRGRATTPEWLKKKVEEGQPKSFEEYYAAMKKGLPENEALKEYSNYLNTLSNKAEKSADYDKRMALASAGFNMAIAAGQPGQAGNALSKFLNAAAIGGASYAQALPKIKQGLLGIQQKIAEDKFRIAEAERKDDMDLRKTAMAEHNADQRAYSGYIKDLSRFEMQNAADEARARRQEALGMLQLKYGLKGQASQAAKLESTEAIANLKAGLQAAQFQVTAAQNALNNPLITPEQKLALENAYYSAVDQVNQYSKHLAALNQIPESVMESPLWRVIQRPTGQ